MQTVLGLSVTATNVQTVLVEGCDADGITLEHDAFDVFSGAESPIHASEQVAEAVLSIAEADGHQLHKIGVTWSEDADLEASLVLDSLAVRGFHNVVPVRLPQAAEALARSIGRVIGYQRTAVCVVEPDAMVLALVDTLDGEVESLVNPSVGDDRQLLDWIASVFAGEAWHPEGLFIVGSVGLFGRAGLAAWLEQGLGVPVFDPPEAELALAHGAALASAHNPVGELDLWYGDTDPWARSTAPDPRRAMRGPALLLAGGAVALVVSTALAITPHTLPDRAVVTAALTQARVDPPAPAAVAPTPAEAPPAPEGPPEAADVPEQVATDEVPAEAPAPAVEAPPIDPAPPEAPLVQEPITEVHQIVQPAPAPVAVAPVPPVPVMAPQQPVVPEVPEARPRLRDRILDKIPGLDRFGH